MEERSWAVVHFTTTAYEPRITNFPLFFTMMIMSKTYIAFSTQPQTPQGVAIDENGLMNYSVFAIKRACQQYLLPTRSHGSRPGLLLFFQRALDLSDEFFAFWSSDVSNFWGVYTPGNIDLVA